MRYVVWGIGMGITTRRATRGTASPLREGSLSRGDVMRGGVRGCFMGQGRGQGVGVNVSNHEGWWVLDTRGYG